MVIIKFLNEAIDVSHHIGEEEDSHELNSHCKEVFILVDRVVVSVPEGGERGEDPIDARDVDCSSVEGEAVISEEALEPSVVVVGQVVIADVVPDASEDLSNKSKHDDEASLEKNYLMIRVMLNAKFMLFFSFKKSSSSTIEIPESMSITRM